MHKKALKIFQISSFLLMSIHPLISLLCNLFKTTPRIQWFVYIYIFIGGGGRGASLAAQMIKNLTAVQETWVWSLSQEDLLEKETATHASIQAWRIPWIGWIVHGITKSWMWLSNFHFSWTPWEFSLIFHGFKYVDSSHHDRQEEKRKWRSGKGFLVFQILPSHLKSCEYTSMRVSAIFWMILKQSILLILNSNIS